MTCPFLAYRTTANDREFAVARAYCTAADEFVQPMRADICNDRYALDHGTDCEIYRAHADEVEENRPDGSTEGVCSDGSTEENCPDGSAAGDRPDGPAEEREP